MYNLKQGGQNNRSNNCRFVNNVIVTNPVPAGNNPNAENQPQDLENCCTNLAVPSSGHEN